MIVSQSKKRPVVWDRPSRIPIRRTTIISRTLAELSRPIIRPSFQTLTPQECYLVRQYAEFWRVWASDAQRIRLANEYHLSQTKHKVLMAWKTIAWHSKREWKLDLKAEIHFKYLLKAKVLASWLDFAYARRRTRQSKQQASVLRRCHVFNRWKAILHKSIVFRQRLLDSDEQYNLCLTIRHFYLWKSYLVQAQRRKAVSDQSIGMRQLRVARIAFMQWKSLVSKQQHVCLVMATLEGRRNSRLKQSVFEGLRQNVDSRNSKNERNRTAYVHRIRTLLRRILTSWQRRQLDMTLFRYQHDLSDMIRKKHSLNLFMRIWGLRIANSLKSKENELRAEAFYECRQKRRLLTVLQHLAAHTKAAITFHSRANQVYFFAKWTNAFRCRKKLRELAYLLPGVKFHESKVVRDMWCFWRTSLLDRKEERANEAKADQIACRRLMRLGFHCWWSQEVAFVSLRRRLGRLERGRDARMIMVIWDIWRRVFDNRRTQRNDLSESAIFHSKSLLRKAVDTWALWVRTNKDQFQQKAMANSFMKLNYQNEHFNRWSCSFQERKHAESMDLLAASIHNWKAYSLFTVWRIRHQERLDLGVKARICDDVWERSLAGKAFNEWRSWTQRSHQLQIQKQNFLFGPHQHAMQLHFLPIWLARLRSIKQEQIETSKRLMDQNRELLREVVWEWHLYAREKSRKKIVRDRMVELAVEAINRVKTATSLNCWRDYVRQRHAKRNLKKLAGDSNKAMILRRHWRRWKDMAFLHVWTEEANTISHSVRNMMVASRYFRTWLSKRPRSEWMNLYQRLLVVPGEHYRISLLRKSFNAIRSFTHECKKKREDRQKIEKRLVDMTAKEGGLKWVEVGDMIRDMQRRDAERKCRDNLGWDCRQFGLVWKYARRWKGRTSIGNAPAGLDIQRRLAPTRQICSLEKFKGTSAFTDSAVQLPTLETKAVLTRIVDPKKNKGSRPPPRTPSFLMDETGEFVPGDEIEIASLEATQSESSETANSHMEPPALAVPSEDVTFALSDGQLLLQTLLSSNWTEQIKLKSTSLDDKMTLLNYITEGANVLPLMPIESPSDGMLLLESILSNKR